MADALAAAQAALAREQRLSALGALAAAAAHELGSPLSTIAVVAKEMLREIEPDDPLREDVELLSAESDRCRAILARAVGRSGGRRVRRLHPGAAAGADRGGGAELPA